MPKKIIPDCDKSITTQEFNKLRTGNFAEWLKQAKPVATNDLNTVKQHAMKNKKYRKLTTIWFKFFHWQKLL